MRIGIDLGGTKIEGLALDELGGELARLRIPTPRNDYPATLQAIASVVYELEARIGKGWTGNAGTGTTATGDAATGNRATGNTATVGVGIPGTIVRSTGLVKNANSTWLIGQPLEADLSRLLARPVRCANDANCLAVSEATDGAAAGAGLVFAVILGTGCGGGIAVQARVHLGPNAIAGEWGHNPLPWATPDELPGAPCYCGKLGCIETWISGTGFARDHAAVTGQRSDGAPLTGAQIVSAADAGDLQAQASLVRLEDRIARSLASLINLLDPDAIVFGGGLSKLDRLYTRLPALIEPYLFGGGMLTPILRAKHGDASGVRGAAWLWPLDTPVNAPRDDRF